MALMKSRVVPASDSASSFATASVAGCLPPIHSRTAQESRTRVFTLALLRLEGCERPHQVAAGALEPSPGGAFRKDNFPPTDLQGQPGAFRQVESFPNLFGDGYLPL